jgi:hypothetical protein
MLLQNDSVVVTSLTRRTFGIVSIVQKGLEGTAEVRTVEESSNHIPIVIHVIFVASV